MTTLTFVTSNIVKFDGAKQVAKELGYNLVQSSMDLQEIQAYRGQEIVLHKATQAYAALQQPVIVSDDTWEIPGLNGFPGPYMKYMNEWLTPEDYLRLTLPLADRRIMLHQHTAYQDATGQHYMVGTVMGTLLTEIRGNNKFSHTTISSFDTDGVHSIAEAIADNRPYFGQQTETVWHKLADWLASRKSL